MAQIFDNPVMIIFGAGALVMIIGILTDYHRRCRKDELDAALKQEELQLKREMIQKGMDADEIEAVLAAHSDGASRKGWLERMLGGK